MQTRWVYRGGTGQTARFPPGSVALSWRLCRKVGCLRNFHSLPGCGASVFFTNFFGRVSFDQLDRLANIPNCTDRGARPRRQFGRATSFGSVLTFFALLLPDAEGFCSSLAVWRPLVAQSVIDRWFLPLPLLRRERGGVASTSARWPSR